MRERREDFKGLRGGSSGSSWLADAISGVLMAEKEGDQLTTMEFNTEVEVEGLITCYLTSLKEMSAIQKSKVDFKEELN